MVATINDATIHYVDIGNPSSIPVVFVHGFPFSHEMWKPQLDEVGKLYRATAYDIRGHGMSFIGDGQFTIEHHVDDLIALLDHLNIWKTVIVGLSMGGYIVLRALERNPERFRGVVLCDTRSEADSDETKLKRFSSMVAAKKNGSAQFADGFVKAVFAKETFDKNPEAVEKIRKIIQRTPPLSIAGTLLALAARTDTTNSLSHINLPTMILVGEHDITTPPSAAQALHERIARSELYLIPGAAHMSNIENAVFFNEKLLAFLKRVASTPE
ncbi:MAG: alpha/beta fold hydrolase [Ignavibacteriae bacterium]|nr:alpha/beta fold hydrolase [Ignavibacteriota bacterium]